MLSVLFQTTSAQVTQEWVAIRPWYGLPKAMIADASGNVFVTGYSVGNGTETDYTTLKYNTLGVNQWEARYNGTGNYHDVPYAIDIDNLGNVYVSGRSLTLNNHTDYVTVKYNSSGVEQWVASYNGTYNYEDYGSLLKVDKLGNVYVSGYTFQNISWISATIKYNTNGIQEWVAYHSSPDKGDIPTALEVDDSGNVFITGVGESIPTGPDYTTVKFNSFGVEQWVAVYSAVPTYFRDYAQSLKIDNSGNVIVTGISSTLGLDYNYLTIKYDQNGQEIWIAEYDGPNNSLDVTVAMEVDQHGNIYVSGYSEGIGSSEDYCIVKYDSSGIEQWVARYNGPENGRDRLNSMALDEYGSVYVTGGSEGGITQLDAVTIKYNTNGVQQWLMRYNGNGNTNDAAYGISLDTSGNVYVVCQANQGQFTTIKYSQDYPLPVELISFTSHLNSRSVNLNWSTSSEINNSGYDIERTFNSDNWSKIGFVNGNGNSNSPNDYTFTDKDLTPGNYKYRLKQIDYNGNFAYHDLENEIYIGNPDKFDLSQNYPNPFNPKTIIKYEIGITNDVFLKVYDVLGNEIATLVNEKKDAGYYTVEFDGSNFASGFYYYKLTAGNFSDTKKMILLK